MKILKSILFSTVFLTGVYESSASLSSEQIEGILNSSSGRPTNFLRTVQQHIDLPLYNKFRNSLNSTQSAAQGMASLRSVLSALRAEEAQKAEVHVEPAIPAPAELILRVSRRRAAEVTTADKQVAHEDLAASVGRVVVASAQGVPQTDEVMSQQSPPKKGRPAPLEVARRDVPEPMVVLDPEVEALKKAQAALRSQIEDLERYEQDFRARYAASEASFETHQAEKSQKQAALEELRRELDEQQAVLGPLLQKKTDWELKVGNAYGSLGVALLNRDETTARAQQEDLERAMQEIYDAPDLYSQGEPRQRIQDILAGANHGLKKSCPLPDLFYRRGFHRLHWESMIGKPAFSTTLKTPGVQAKYKLDLKTLEQVAAFNRALVECLQPAHLDFPKIAAKSLAVAAALADNNDEDLRKFLQEDGFEAHKKVLQAKNYRSSLDRITEKLKAVSLDLAAAKVKRDQDAIKKAVATLTSAGLSADIEKWTADAVDDAIDSQFEAVIAQISVESFKETTLPKIYGPTMEALNAQWDAEEKKREAWLGKVNETLLEDDSGIQTLQGKISSLQAQTQSLGQEISDLDGILAQEFQGLKIAAEEGRALGAQLDSFRQQQV